MGVLFEKPQEGYKANLISTIVDLQLQLIMFLAIKPI